MRRDEAILTGAAGGALGLSGRGVVAVGAYADFCCSTPTAFSTPHPCRADLPPGSIDQSSSTAARSASPRPRRIRGR